MNDKQQLAAMGEHLAEQQPLCMAKRIEELEGQVRVLAELLRDLREGAEVHLHNCTVCKNELGIVNWTSKLERIDASLAGNLPSATAPEGWQLVPVEPTKDMREAFHEAHEEWESGDDWRLDSPDHQWRAMLAASPSPDTTK